MVLTAVGRAEVDAKRSELLSLKQTVNAIYAEYKSQAEIRMSRQKEMANLVQLVQNNNHNNNNHHHPYPPVNPPSTSAYDVVVVDTALVEDVILASLWAETRALKAKQPIPPTPKIKEDDLQPTLGSSTMTKSAEEAMAVYTYQIQLLTNDKIYRQVLLENEIAMAEEFGQGLDQIEAIVRDYCENPTLRNMVLQRR